MTSSKAREISALSTSSAPYNAMVSACRRMRLCANLKADSHLARFSATELIRLMVGRLITTNAAEKIAMYIHNVARLPRTKPVPMKYVVMKTESREYMKAGGFSESVVKFPLARDVRLVGRYMMSGSSDVNFAASLVMTL